jgi:hypothetical protein
VGLLEVFKQAIIATADDDAKLQALEAAVKSGGKSVSGIEGEFHGWNRSSIR